MRFLREVPPLVGTLGRRERDHELRSDDGLYHLVPRRSPSQASAQEAAQWVVEQLAAQRGIA